MKNTNPTTMKVAQIQNQLPLIEQMCQIQFDPYYSAWIPYALNQHIETLNEIKSEIDCSVQVKETQEKCIELKEKFEAVNKPGTSLKY